MAEWRRPCLCRHCRGRSEPVHIRPKRVEAAAALAAAVDRRAPVPPGVANGRGGSPALSDTKAQRSWLAWACQLGCVLIQRGKRIGVCHADRTTHRF
jgi:hypothetical protein